MQTVWKVLAVTVVVLGGAGAQNVDLIRSTVRPATVQANSTEGIRNDESPCRKCHADEVDGFARSEMAHSMRLGGWERPGVVHAPGSTITMYSDKYGSWQRLESHGSTNTYHVDYVIGSGAHASGYLTMLGDHLFQSPVSYYKGRAAYGLAPGYEGRPDPDFTRPIREACVFCHAGSFDEIPGTQNEYGKPPFPHLAIGCDRCHGSAVAHLAKPDADNIIAPQRLEPAARDSVCEQCHLIGVERVLNPGKRFTDFRPGQPLEATFTTYVNKLPAGATGTFRVISQSEELALSVCKRSSGERMWCGTCHDPHYEPTEPIAYYRERCLLCHAKTNFAADHPSKTSNCIGCHMPKRATDDGGHTAFTDHRIQRRPGSSDLQEATDIAPWRMPPSEVEERNLGIASVQLGLEHSSGKEIVAGYRMLTDVQGKFTEDSELYNTIGDALFAGQQYGEAAQAFELAVRLDPKSSLKEAKLGQAYGSLGEISLAEQHLERAMNLDPLNLSAATLLINTYRENSESSKADELSKRIAQVVQRSATH